MKLDHPRAARASLVATSVALIATLAVLSCAPAAPAGPHAGAAPGQTERVDTDRAQEQPVDPAAHNAAPLGGTSPHAPEKQQTGIAGEAYPQVASILAELTAAVLSEFYQGVNVARVRVGTETKDVMAGTGLTLRRQSLEVTANYRGTLPDDIDIAVDHNNMPNSQLTAGSEYIVVVHKAWYLGDANDDGLTQDQLDAVGGEAYFYVPNYLWFIDGTEAVHLPMPYLFGLENATVTHSSASASGFDSTVLATLETELRTLPAQAAGSPVAEQATPSPGTATEALAVDADRYDGVGKIRVTSQSNHTVDLDGTTWPSDQRQPVYTAWKRTSVEVLETYRGTMPATFDIINDFHGAGRTNQNLDVGTDYVLFVVKKWLPTDEHTDDDRRFHFTDAQLTAIGGEGYTYFTDHVWIIDGEKALHVPKDHITNRDTSASSHLAAARAAGVSVPLADLKSGIAAAE